MNYTLNPKPVTTFVATVWPQINWKQEVVLILISSWLVALSAQLVIPLQPVPVSGQTFGVLLIAALLGSRRGAAAILAYLGQGAAGLPVFAGGTGGLAVLAGPTGGYLVGFVVAAFVVGRLSERSWDRRPITTAAAMIVGNIIIYLAGLAWLSFFVSMDILLAVGLYPFLIGDLLKIGVATAVLPLAWRMVSGER